MPLPANDPRRKPKVPKPVGGSTPGVGYTPLGSALSYAGNGLPDYKPQKINVLPKDTKWNIETLTEAFGPLYTHGSTGPDGSTSHSTDYEQILRSNFANRTAEWITDPADYATYNGNPTEWEVLYAYYTADRRVRRVVEGAAPTSMMEQRMVDLERTVSSLKEAVERIEKAQNQK